MTTSHWSADEVAAIAGEALPTAPLIDRAAVRPLLRDLDVWDHWPVQHESGDVACIAGGALVMLLAAPRLPDPEERHDVARIRLMHRRVEEWTDLGPLFPDDFSPGSREWAGSAILSADRGHVTVYFTAAGVRGEPVPSFVQRLFETRARLHLHDGVPRLNNWSSPKESVAADGDLYASEMTGGGAIGTIKAFRDPAWFRDPTDGRDHLVFTASMARSRSRWNGAIGIARRRGAHWKLAAPLIEADGVNNELERPHVVVHAGRYYLFWSTQRKVFAEGGPSGPTGLYGMTAAALGGPWAPMNKTGLVFANPPEAPAQMFSWLVTSDLRVWSFVDLAGLARAPRDSAEARAHFGGTPAPVLELRLDGDRSALI